MTMKRIGVWVLAVLLALEFSLAGASKFVASTWPRMFATWGFPPWARPAVGAVEVLCAVALLVPRVRIAACGVLIAVMAGATITHLTHGETPRVVLTLGLAALLALLAWVSGRRGNPRS